MCYKLPNNGIIMLMQLQQKLQVDGKQVAECLQPYACKYIHMHRQTDNPQTNDFSPTYWKGHHHQGRVASEGHHIAPAWWQRRIALIH